MMNEDETQCEGLVEETVDQLSGLHLNTELQDVKEELIKTVTALRDKTEEIKSLQETIDHQYAKILDLEQKLDERNETCTKLGLRVKHLENENQEQAARYYQLHEQVLFLLARLTLRGSSFGERVELDSPVNGGRFSRQASQLLSSTDPTYQFDPNKEKLFQQVVRDNLSDFIKWTNYEELGSFLFSEKLLNETEHNKLTGHRTNLEHREKGNYFYVEVLPTKGNQAYSLLRYCLSKAKDHLGHECLLNYLDGENEIEEQQQQQQQQ